MRSAVSLVLIATALCVFSLPAEAQSGSFFDGRNTFFGVKAGLVTPLTVAVENGYASEYDTDANYSVGGFVDYALSPRLTGGLLLDATNLDEEMLFDVSFTLKALVGSNPRLMFRPGFGLGYGRWDESNQLTIRAGVELCVPMASKGAYVLEAMLYGSPAGGDDDYWVTFGPGGLVRVGLIF